MSRAGPFSSLLQSEVLSMSQALRITRSALQRWVALDRELLSVDGLDIKEFAARWGVNCRTIRHDLKTFAELGQTTSYRNENAWDGRSRQWRYDDHVKYLFACNLDETALKAAMKARKAEVLAAKRKAQRIREATRRKLRRIPR